MTFGRRKLLAGIVTLLGLDPSRFALAEPEPVALLDAELVDLVAFAEALVGSAPLSSAEREYLVDHIERRVKQGSGYYLGLYRTTVGLLNRLAGARVSRLDISGRAALMARHRLMVADVSPGEDFGPFPEDARAVRTRAVPDLIGAYFGSPAGWAVVGYGEFPGKCGDLTRYTRAES